MEVLRTRLSGVVNLSAPPATQVMQELLEFSLSDQLVQMVPQIPVVFGGISLVLVVVAIKALIAPHRVSCHLIWSFEERLVLNFFQYLVH